MVWRGLHATRWVSCVSCALVSLSTEQGIGADKAPKTDSSTSVGCSIQHSICIHTYVHTQFWHLTLTTSACGCSWYSLCYYNDMLHHMWVSLVIYFQKDCALIACVFSLVQIEETQSLLAENARLNEEVADLKRSLIRLETLRGST